MFLYNTFCSHSRTHAEFAPVTQGDRFWVHNSAEDEIYHFKVEKVVPPTSCIVVESTVKAILKRNPLPDSDDDGDDSDDDSTVVEDKLSDPPEDDDSDDEEDDVVVLEEDGDSDDDAVVIEKQQRPPKAVLLALPPPDFRAERCFLSEDLDDPATQEERI